MPRFCLVFLAVVMLGGALPVFAQRSVRNAKGYTWNGAQPKVGGSPPASVRMRGQARTGYGIPTYIIPYAVESPAPVAAPLPVALVVVVDTVYASATSSPYEMQVVPTHARRELTTMEVYRQQRFHQP